MKITLPEMVQLLRSYKLVKKTTAQIDVANVDAIFGRDIFELYLFLSKARKWKWKDPKGKELYRRNIPINIINIIRDLLLWPFYLYYIHFTIKLLEPMKKAGLKVNFSNNIIFFLRTDHMFNIVSGGSVGHISGVINGFRNLKKKVIITSSDYLSGIKKEDFYLCEPKYSIGQNIPNISELLYNKKLIRLLNTKIKQYKPSFVYQRYSLGNFAGSYIRANYGIPYICEYNGSFIWMERNWGKKLFHETLLNKIELLNLNTADVIVVVSQPMKEELTERGVDEDKILVNPNGVDLVKYNPGINCSTVKANYKLQSKTTIGFIGTFAQWHGVVEMAKAIVHFFNHYNGKNVNFLLIGNGVLIPDVKQIINNSKYNKNVVFTDEIPQDEAPEYLAACDIFLSPHIPNPDGSKFFGSPTKLFEYMAMGKAIIASDLDQIGDILEHKKTAWLVEPGNIEDLSSAINILVHNKTLCKTLGLNARKEVIHKYSWDHHVNKILDKLNEM